MQALPLLYGKSPRETRGPPLVSSFIWGLKNSGGSKQNPRCYIALYRLLVAFYRVFEPLEEAFALLIVFIP